MATVTRSMEVKTRGFSDIHDITPQVRDALAASKCSNGVATVFVPGSTAALTTLEYEPGAVEDLRNAIERMVPRDLHYAHDARWGDGNGFAHVRAALVGASLAIPFVAGELCLGTWQQIILIDFDNRSRVREVIAQIQGE